MPLRKYCTQCGKPTEYNTQEPKFCMHCGNSFSVNKSPVSPTLANQSIEIQDFEEGESPKRIQNLGLKIEFEKPQRTKMADIMGTGAEGLQREPTIPKKKMSKKDTKEFVKNWMKQKLSSSKNSPSDIS